MSGRALHLAEQRNVQSLRESFVAERRVHISNILVDDSAQRLLAALKDEIKWLIAFNFKGQHRHTTEEAFNALDLDARQGIERAIHEGAHTGFQYYYRNYPILELVEAKLDVHPLMRELLGFLNSKPFLSFARQVTGFDDIAFCDAQATCFGPGHFLTQHKDDVDGKNRRAAYIISLSENWRADWGGHLAFLDDKGHIERAILPVFNSLNILAVPQPHSVTYVTPFAGKRYSITGWLRTK